MRTYRPMSRNGRNYTEFFAWWPSRMTSGRWVWFNFYYLRPNSNGQGVLVSAAELANDRLD